MFIQGNFPDSKCSSELYEEKIIRDDFRKLRKGANGPPHSRKGGHLVRVRAEGPKASAEGATPY
jgi:hypothetical protein